MTISLGFTLQPDVDFLERCASLFEEVDYLEVTPETTWRPGAAGGWQPNDYHGWFLELGRARGLGFVAHGVGLSVGSVDLPEERQRCWLERIARDQEAFEFAWYSDHLGATQIAGEELILPLPLPMDAAFAAIVRGRLAELAEVAPLVGLENTANYAHVGAPLDEGPFLAACLDLENAHLVLDLHNAFTTARNTGVDVDEYLARMPLERVIEVHVSGGAESDPRWLRSGRVMRLDSHDHDVPEEVWALLERWLPRCPNVRGVTLERMEGTVEPQDVEPLAAELRRARKILEATGG